MLRATALLLTTFAAFAGQAQCAMCTKAAMDGMKDGATTSAGINDGILYLLSMPYLLALSIAAAFFWWRWRARREEAAGA